MQDINCWKKVWSAELPIKVRNFGRRALKNAIPVRSNLKQRGVNVDDRCPCCGVEPEDVVHLLLECCNARMIWAISPLRLEVTSINVTSFREWVCSLMNVQKDSVWWDLFWSLAWSIWLMRNAWCFEGVKKSFEICVQKGTSLVGEYAKVRAVGKATGMGSVMPTKWSPPPGNIYKLNTDAAVFGNDINGYGAVVRDEFGDVMMATCDIFKGKREVHLVEAMAARHALRTAMDAGLRKLVLETDCLELYCALKKGVL